MQRTFKGKCLMFANPAVSSKWIFALCAILVAAIVALTYWPVAHAQFIYDDVLDFRKMAWLRHGDAWQELLFRRFNDWVAYFRPLVVALFTLEVRLFGSEPGPMHLTSLALHLFNTLLVGVLAAKLLDRSSSGRRSAWMPAVAMLLYGLHPVLIEPVVWIGCQFELVATLFMLLGWLINIGVKSQFLRAAGVASCFFLAACAKESAITFPFVVVVLDWFVYSVRGRRILANIRVLLACNGTSYASIFMAGAVYLLLRHWALGALMPSNGTHPLPAWARFQEVSFLYLRYWQMFFWPTIGMGPSHPVATQPFFGFSPLMALTDLAALCTLAAGIWLTLRQRYSGALILSATFALLPVLHVFGGNYDSSLYHERYAMTALALICVWLPGALMEISPTGRMQRVLSFGGVLVLVVWLSLSVMTIRTTIPLWSNDLQLWSWSLQENPDSIGAKDELISAYMDKGNDAAAWRLIDEVVRSNQLCVNCMLNAAILSLKENNPNQASRFLEKLRDLPTLYVRPEAYRTYLTTIAQVNVLQGQPQKAESVARASMQLDNLDPAPQLTLAVALAMQGKIAQSRQVENKAITLLVPDEQAMQRRKFEDLLKSLHPIPSNNSP